MKKIGILLAILLVAGVCAMAEEVLPEIEVSALFADIEAVPLTYVEMVLINGGQHTADTFEDGDPRPNKISRNNDTVAEQKTLDTMKRVLKAGAQVALGGALWGVRGAVAVVGAGFIDVW